MSPEETIFNLQMDNRRAEDRIHSLSTDLDKALNEGERLMAENALLKGIIIEALKK